MVVDFVVVEIPVPLVVAGGGDDTTEFLGFPACRNPSEQVANISNTAEENRRNNGHPLGDGDGANILVIVRIGLIGSFVAR